MSSPKIIFGTDGWRAVVADDFTYENVRAVAQGVADHLAGDARPVVVGHDTRYCAELFAREVARVLAANGKTVHLLDRPSPTPVASFSVVDRQAAGAVVVTASHNPPEFNGLKFKPDFGGSAPPEVTTRLEELTARAQSGSSGGVRVMDYEQASSSGLCSTFDPRAAYFTQLGRVVDLERLRGAGLRILHECMFGAGSGYVAATLEGGGTTVEELHAERNPGFGGMHPEPIAHYMPEAMHRMAGGGFDLCIANDGDADRVGIVDERGTFINQLQMMALYSMYFLEKRGERGPLVRSLTSTSMADRIGERFGVEVHEMPVGFKYLGPKFTETNAIIAGEESGGFAFRGHIPERDGVLAGLLAADMIIAYDMPLSRIVAHLEELVGPHAYARHDVRLAREGYEDRKRAMYEQIRNREPRELAGARVARTRTDDGFKFYLEDGSWVLLRMSGTEPLIRVYSEARDLDRVEALLASLEEQVGLGEPAAGVAEA